MALPASDLARIAALDAAYAFLEEPEVSLAGDVATGCEGAPPVGIKSNIRVAGQSWTAGIDGRRDERGAKDADVVAMLRQAGMGFLSRLNMDEAALGAACLNPAFRTTKNPAAPDHSPGGSSGGSAAAVAAGACDVALGTDTLGSVRIPAAYCGVFGLKLGHGALSMEGVFPLAPSLDALGVLGRSTEGIRHVLSACGLHDHGRATSIALIDDIAHSALSNEVTPLLVRAEAALGKAGFKVEHTALDLDGAAVRSDAFLRTEIEASEALADQVGMSVGLRKMLDYGASIATTRRAEIDTRLNAVCARVTDAVAGDRFLLLPTVAEPAFPLGARAPKGQADFTALANVAGLPAVSIPIPSDGLPMSVQLIGPRDSEWTLLALADAITTGG